MFLLMCKPFHSYVRKKQNPLVGQGKSRQLTGDRRVSTSPRLLGAVEHTDNWGYIPGNYLQIFASATPLLISDEVCYLQCTGRENDERCCDAMSARYPS